MTDPSTAWIPVLTGQKVGDYALGRCLGRGGFGLVFEATNDATKASVAVKVLTPTTDTDAVIDFDNEGVLLRKLNTCKGVINFVDGGTQVLQLHGPGGVPIPIEIRFHVLTLASGTLEELLLDPVARNQLSWEERLRLWRWAVKSLMQMHGASVAHRDLKASNCLLMVQGNVTRVRFADLGRAKDLSLGAVRDPQTYLTGRGDFRFASPEALLFQGGVTPDDFLAADYYGLGSLLVEITTGQSMTTLAIGDIHALMAQGFADHQAGVQRDINGLGLRYRTVVSEVIALMPPSIRDDARAVLTSLCHPNPAERLAQTPYSKDRASREKLAWILRRVDIMIRRIEIDARDARRRERVSA